MANETPVFSATVEGQYLVVRVPLQSPTRSSTGRTLIVANSGGPKATEAEVSGKKVTVNVSAWIKP